MKDALNEVTNIFNLGGGDGDGMEVWIITSPISFRGRSELIVGGETTMMNGEIILTPLKGFLYDPLFISKTK